MDWWLIVKIRGEVHCWPVGATDDQERMQDLLARARVLLGFPVGDGWVDTADVDIQLTHGEPHPQLLAAATVHELSDLEGVTADAVAAYRGEAERQRRAVLADAARAALAALGTEELAVVLAEHGRLPPPQPVRPT